MRLKRSSGLKDIIIFGKCEAYGNDIINFEREQGIRQ